MKYAIKCYFTYGLDYIGSDGDNNRLLFDTVKEAEADLIDLCNDSDYELSDFKVVIYNPQEDTKEDLIS